jgi:hypothetical protein
VTHVDYVKIFHRSTHAIEKNTEGLIGAGKEIGLEVNALKTK